MALAERIKILEYPSWRKVLAKLGIKPLTLDLPDPETVVSSSNREHSGYGGGDWTGYNVTITAVPPGMNTFKITLYSGTGYSYDPEVSSVTLGYSHYETDDPLNDWSLTSGHTANLSFDGTNATYFLGDTSRVRRTVDDTESFYYVESGLTSVHFRVFTKTVPLPSSVLQLYYSTDGGATFPNAVHYTLGTAMTGGGGDWYYYDITPNDLPSNANGFQITLSSGTGYSYDPEISSATLIAAH